MHQVDSRIIPRVKMNLSDIKSVGSPATMIWQTNTRRKGLGAMKRTLFGGEPGEVFGGPNYVHTLERGMKSVRRHERNGKLVP